MATNNDRLAEILAFIKSPTEESLRAGIKEYEDAGGAKVNGPVFGALRRRLGIAPPPRAEGRRVKHDSAVAVPGQFTEALRLAAHISKLNEEEHRLENRLIEIRKEKAQYKDVVAAMEALKRRVDESKEIRA